MLGFILILLIFGGLAIIFRWLSKICYAADRYLQERTNETDYHRRVLVQSLSHIEAAIAPEENKISYTQSLINANRVIQEKRNLKKAMSEELGITD